MLRPFSSMIAMAIMFTILILSCQKKKEIVPDIFHPRNDHEAYGHSLDQAGILATALGEDWLAAADVAIKRPLIVDTPFEEDFYFDPVKANSIGYRFDAKQGHRVEISIETTLIDSTRLFMDVYRIDNDSLSMYTHVASMDRVSQFLHFEPQVDAYYIVRFQSELLRGGRFTIKILEVPTLAFPVSGKDKRAIGSIFGAPRDAGRRVHHGVDIFAHRHTPIIAPTNGKIRSTKDNELGGKVIWLRDERRGQTMYFAHLQDVKVTEGAYVTMGDTIGTVGNSGNARTTAPHLHFGIYKSGPIDPYHFIVETKTKLRRRLAKESIVGLTMRTNNVTQLKVLDITRNSKRENLPKDQIIKVLGRSAAYYRVMLPDMSQGYIVYDKLEKTEEPLSLQQISDEQEVLSQPSIAAIQIDKIKSGAQVKVLGKNSDYSLVEYGQGETGWVLGL